MSGIKETLRHLLCSRYNFVFRFMWCTCIKCLYLQILTTEKKTDTPPSISALHLCLTTVTKTIVSKIRVNVPFIFISSISNVLKGSSRFPLQERNVTAQQYCELIAELAFYLSQKSKLVAWILYGNILKTLIVIKYFLIFKLNM